MMMNHHLQRGTVNTVLKRISEYRTTRGKLVNTFFLREPSTYHTGGVLQNRLGWQVLRLLEKQTRIGLRPRRPVPAEVQPALATLERDGIVVLPDFLPPADFEAVQAEYQMSRTDLHRSKYTMLPVGDNFVCEELRISAHSDVFPTFKRGLQENPFLTALVEGATRRPLSYPILPLLQIFSKPDPAAPYTDGPEYDVLHADRHYPCFKGFYHIHDVTAENGAFIYCVGSHRLSLDRIRHEYDLSVRQAFKQNGQIDRIPADLLERGFNKIQRSFLAKLNIRETQFPARANTLIVSNNFGFHRRGAFTGDGSRAFLYMDFKYLESAAYHLFPIVRRLPI
jgi:hypothetical protein